jgi:hypothetical protein
VLDGERGSIALLEGWEGKEDLEHRSRVIAVVEIDEFARIRGKRKCTHALRSGERAPLDFEASLSTEAWPAIFVVCKCMVALSRDTATVEASKADVDPLRIVLQWQISRVVGGCVVEGRAVSHSKKKSQRKREKGSDAR